MKTHSLIHLFLAAIVCLLMPLGLCADHPRFDPGLMLIARQNIEDLSEFTAHDELYDVYAICLAAFDRTLSDEEMNILRELSDGTTVIASNQPEYYWQTAVNIALYLQDHDIDRLLDLARKSSRALALPALSALCMMNPDENIGDLFFDRFVFADLAERKGFEVNQLMLNIIADGLKQHDQGALSARIAEHMEKHPIGPDIRNALLQSFGSERVTNATHQVVVDTLMKQIQNAKSFSAAIPRR